jgi:DEAD/DEAH box helicase domain-containing protein
MYREVFFDLETKKLFDQIPDPSKVADLGVSVVSVYRRLLDDNLAEVEGEMKSFWEADFPTMWPIFENADRIVGFNSIKFDAPVIAPFYQQRDFLKLPHFDILARVKDVLGHRLSLDALAKETLGESKLASGLEAVDWWNAGDAESLAKLKKYCEQDVYVTMKLYDHAMKQGRLRFKNKWNEIKEFEIDFAYPPIEAQAQMGLF